MNDLEPVCHLFLALNPPKEGPFHSNKGYLGSRDGYLDMKSNLLQNDDSKILVPHPDLSRELPSKTTPWRTHLFGSHSSSYMGVSENRGTPKWMDNGKPY